MRQRVSVASVGRLVTIGPAGPDIVPFCFALAGDTLYSAVDHKPKQTFRLRRLANIKRQPSVSVLVDHYEDDWSRLWWVRIRGSAMVVESDARAVDLLVAKYPQYQEVRPAGPFVVIAAEEWRGWQGWQPAR